MKRTFQIAILLLAPFALAQVGINTDAPKATLDVKVNTTTTDKPDGFIAPRLSGNDLKTKDALYGNEQTGTIVYATAASSDAGVANAKTTNVAAAGYYYFDGAIWQKINEGSGAAGSEPWQIQSTANPATANGQNIYQNGNVAVGFTSSDAESDKKFEVKGTYKLNHDLDEFHHTIVSPITTNYATETYTDPGILQYVSNTDDINGMLTAFDQDRDCTTCTEEYYVQSFFPVDQRYSVKAVKRSDKRGSSLDVDSRAVVDLNTYDYSDPTKIGSARVYLLQDNVYISTNRKATPDDTQDPNNLFSQITLGPENLQITLPERFELSVKGNKVSWPATTPQIGQILKITSGGGDSIP